MVYIDGIQLRATTPEELHRFARKIVLSRSWFRKHPYACYDVICTHNRERAFKNGAMLRIEDNKFIKIDYGKET